MSGRGLAAKSMELIQVSFEILEHTEGDAST
jgi:hypothetical protein